MSKVMRENELREDFDIVSEVKLIYSNVSSHRAMFVEL